MKLEQINVKNLGFDHSIYSKILDIKSKPFIEMPKLFYDIFKESFKKYKLNHNDIIINTCKEIIHCELEKLTNQI